MKGGHLVTHNMSYTKIYKIWVGMRRRTSKFRNQEPYRTLGMSERWSKFENFYNDFGYTFVDGKGLTIDRIDNSIGYFPGNVRFVSHVVNSRNQTRRVINEEIAANIRADFANGMKIMEMCRKYDISRTVCTKAAYGKTWMPVEY